MNGKTPRIAERFLIPSPSEAGIRTALCFPNTYELGMSNLGFQQVYRILAETDGVRVLRAFAEKGTPKNFEDDSSLGTAEVLAFSLPYEADYPNAIRMLLESGIPLRHRERGERDPFVILGGIAVTANPFPLSSMADAVVLGEAEEILPGLISLLTEGSREEVLKRAATLPGVFVPALTDSQPDLKSLDRLEVPNLNAHPCHSAILTPNTVFGDTFLLEVSRGCKRGCRFCLTGALHPGLRVRSLETLKETLDGFKGKIERVGLIGAELTSHPNFSELLEYLLSCNLSATVSSLEVDRLTPEMVQLMARLGARSLTIAPETGTEETRRKVGKRFGDETVIEAARYAASATIRGLKVYFLLGLPDGDVREEAEAVICLSRKIAEAFLDPPFVDGMARTVSISISPWVPKPLTPWFEKGSMVPVRTLKTGMNLIRKALAGKKGIEVVSPSFSETRLDAEISRGGMDLFEWLVGKVGTP